MEYIIAIIVAFALSAELFTVSTGSSANYKFPATHRLIVIALVFVVFQLLFLTAGWYIGGIIDNLMEYMGKLLAFPVYSVVGIKILWEAYRIRTGERAFFLNKLIIATGVGLASGFNTLITGMAVRFDNIDLKEAIIPLAVFSFLLTLAGFYTGKYYGCKYNGKWIKIAGGTILILLGIKCLLQFNGII